MKILNSPGVSMKIYWTDRGATKFAKKFNCGRPTALRCRRLPSELSRRPPGSRGRFRACSGPEMAEHVRGGMRGKPRGPATGHTPRVWSTPPQKQSPPWSTEEVLSPPCAPAAIAHPGPCARRMGMCDGCGAQCHVSLACVPSIVVGCSVDPPRPGRRTWPSI